jgi:predicted GIY-YIG superfamily endonuclease
MHWVYVLRCSRDGHIYVGETRRLYTRFYEHQFRNGAMNTRLHPPDEIIGLYKVINSSCYHQVKEMKQFTPLVVHEWTNDCDDDENALEVEDIITESLMVTFGMNKVRGGQYTTNSRASTFDPSTFEKDRPTCKCGLPCDVKLKHDKSKVFFVCPVPDWEEFYDGLDIPERCDFWEEFVDYRQKRELYLSRMKDSIWITNMPTSNSAQIYCECCETSKKAMWYRGKYYKMCEDCFYYLYDDLKKRYKRPRPQIITISE